VADSPTVASALAPGVALTSAVIYWANLQSRLDSLSSRVRTLNAELRASAAPTPRTDSVGRQIGMLLRRSRVLHLGVVLSVVALIAFLGASATLFLAAIPLHVPAWLPTTLFFIGLVAFGAALLGALWEMLWARRSLEEDVQSSAGPHPRAGG
jgi:hypothetical protein